MKKAYQITNSGVEAASGGQIIMGKEKLDYIDLKLLNVLMGEEEFDNTLGNEYAKRIPRLEKLGFVSKVNV